jgi:hypothetical protein
MDDEALLARAEQALTEIKVNQGLSEDHAAVLAALRIRLRGSEGASLDALLAAAEETGSRTLDDELAAERPTGPGVTLDDLLARGPDGEP